MLLAGIRESFNHGLPLLSVAGRPLTGTPVAACQLCHLSQEGAPEAIGLEGSVPHGPEGRAGLLALAEVLALGGMDAAVVDGVALHHLAPPGSPRPPEHLLCPETNLTRQQAEAGCVAVPGLEVVEDTVREHLVAAADTEHRPLSRGTVPDHLRQAALPEPRQVRDGGPRPGQHRQVGIPDLFR